MKLFVLRRVGILWVLYSVVFGVLLWTTVSSQPQLTLKASRGWLYVVSSDYYSQAGRIVLIDPEQPSVRGTLTTGYQSDFALSRDGERLFVSYDNTLAAGSVFSVIDASSGQVTLQHQESDTRGGMPTPYLTRMALSRDGSLLFRYKARYTTTSGSWFGIQTFDTTSNRFLPNVAPLPLCGNAELLPSARRNVLLVVCSQSEDVRVITLAEGGGLQSSNPPRVPLGVGTKAGFVPSIISQGGREATIIKSDGSFLSLDATSGRLLAIGDVGRNEGDVTSTGAPPTGWLEGRVLRKVTAFHEGSRAYGFIEGDGATSREIIVLDSSSWLRITSWPTSRSYADIQVSVDGAELYGVDRDSGSVVVMHTTSGQELRVITGLGPGLVFAKVAR